MNRAAAAACYVPVPVLAWLVARAAPADRLVRHHAWQGGIVAVALWALLLPAGFLLRAPDLAPVATVASAAAVGLGLAAIGAGVTGAALGRFWRIRPAWDVAAALQPRRPARPSGRS